MNKLIKKVKYEKGQVAVIVALLMSIFVGMTAYVIDVGSMYEVRRNAQTAADAAALAGAQDLPENPDLAKEEAIDYVNKENINVNYGSVTLDESNIQFSEDFCEIKVQPVYTATPLFFSGIFGLTSKAISATATARVYSPESLGYLVPWIVKESEIEYGDDVILKSNSPLTPGNFQAMDYNGGGGGAHEYRESIIYGYDGLVKVGESYPIEPGNMAGPTGQGVDTRIGDDTCEFEDVTDLIPNDKGTKVTDMSCPRIVFVPVTNDWEENPTEPLLIKSFKVFYIDEIILDHSTGHEQALVTGLVL